MPEQEEQKSIRLTPEQVARLDPFGVRGRLEPDLEVILDVALHEAIKNILEEEVLEERARKQLKKVKKEVLTKFEEDWEIYRQSQRQKRRTKRRKQQESTRLVLTSAQVASLNPFKTEKTKADEQLKDLLEISQQAQKLKEGILEKLEDPIRHHQRLMKEAIEEGRRNAEKKREELIAKLREK